MKYYREQVAGRLLQRKRFVGQRVRGLVFGIEIMQSYKLKKPNIPARFPVFHKMTIQVTHFDQFSGQVTCTNHLECEQEKENFLHWLKLATIKDTKHAFRQLGA